LLTVHVPLSINMHAACTNTVCMLGS